MALRELRWESRTTIKHEGGREPTSREQEPLDYRALDQPAVLRALFYPEKTWLPASEGCEDHAVPVTDGVRLSGRFYPLSREAPSILLFHGNGEVACHYDAIAAHYHDTGANLFVVDYRGYGLSGGRPSISSMMEDALPTYHYFSEYLERAGYTGPKFVMGRSLGSQPALQIAMGGEVGVSGVIIESGFGGVERLFTRLGGSGLSPDVQRLIQAHQQRLESVRLPLLVIHGEADEIVPVEMGIELYDAAGSASKEIVLVPNAGHNDLLWVAPEAYFSAVKLFLHTHGGPRGE